MIFLVGAIAYNMPSAKEILQIKPGSIESLYLASEGGHIDAAFDFANVIRKAKVTCHVDMAVSAALQIILPACSTIFLNKESILVPHLTHAVLSTETLFNKYDLVLILKKVMSDDKRIFETWHSKFPKTMINFSDWDLAARNMLRIEPEALQYNFVKIKQDKFFFPIFN